MKYRLHQRLLVTLGDPLFGCGVSLSRCWVGWFSHLLLEHDRTRTNSNKLEQTRTNSNTPKNGGIGRQNPMNYEEWSKSNELDQTLTPKFATLEEGKQERSLKHEEHEAERREERDEVGQVHLFKKPIKHGTWPTWPTFFEVRDWYRPQRLRVVIKQEKPGRAPFRLQGDAIRTRSNSNELERTRARQKNGKKSSKTL